MISFILDIFNFIIFFTKKYEIGFFVENKNIFEYLKPYLLKKSKKKKIAVITFEKLDKINFNVDIYYFKSNLIRELVFSTLKLKFLYSSTPNLNNNIFKKSKFSSCKYIYLSHTPVSMTLIYRPNSFSNFDAVQVTNEYQFKEMNEIKGKNNLKIKIFKSKYLFVKQQQKKISTKKSEYDVLIAPSWNSNFYNTGCHIKLIELLKKKNLSYRLRPHPMSYKKKEIDKKELEEKDVLFDNDKLINFKKFKFIISDWSGIFIEYSLIFRKKAFLINTPKKMVNNDYDKYKNKPIEITMRDILGESYEIDNIPQLIDRLYNLKKEQTNSEDKKFNQIIDNNFY